jgi:hypothetical protein
MRRLCRRYICPMATLFHVSETPDIARFDPRPDNHGAHVVWAIDISHLPNYLLPRDCPRVCLRRTRVVHSEHEERRLCGQDHAIYVETTWRDRIRDVELFCYAFDAHSFQCVDANAGYFQTRVSVVPRSIERIRNVEARIAAHSVALRDVESLLPVQDFAVRSSLEFSCIRMHNAGGLRNG